MDVKTNPEKRYHHGDLKRTLMEVADRELATIGFDGLSLRAVAKKAGVSHTAPYRHFTDKSQLLGSLVIQSYQKLFAQLDEVEWRYPDLQSQLTAFAHIFIEVVTRNPRKAQFMFTHPMADADVDAMLGKIKNQILEKLQEICIDGGASRSLATAFWSALVGLGVLISSQDPTFHAKSVEELQSLAEEVTATLF